MVPNGMILSYDIDYKRRSYPFCIVWTPLPVLSWFLPFIGHMGIATSQGVIRDFAGPYYVAEGNMAFGSPTKYWQLDPMHARGGPVRWDAAVAEASEVYCERNHNLCFDNCHSMVAMALNLMNYNETRWNMVKLAYSMIFYGRYVGVTGFLKTYFPFFILLILAFFVYSVTVP